MRKPLIKGMPHGSPPVVSPDMTRVDAGLIEDDLPKVRFECPFTMY